MDTTTFWSLIESAKQLSGGMPSEQVRRLTDELAQRSEAEIIAFHTRFRYYYALSYTQDLWAAAYILNGGCSDDCFDYFRAWLIAQGETVFHNAVRDPETLANHAEIEETELEAMLYVANIAYERKTGSRMPPQPPLRLMLTGEAWEEATVYQKYPKLAAKWSS